MKRKAGIISISGLVLTKNEKAIIKAGKPWGIILFKRNIKNMSQCIQLINSIRATINDKKYPILIDEEGGRVTRLSDFLDNSLYNQNYFGDLYSLNQDVGAAVYKNYINSMSIILKKIARKSKKKGIDTKITKKIWSTMISSYIDYEFRNFKKK